ncbi:MAG TPA: hypothetical protein PKI78_12115, partial [Anaerolineales bacterium]|nr:hypothetical protein [Anaerolineales bacterium]
KKEFLPAALLFAVILAVSLALTVNGADGAGEGKAAYCPVGMQAVIASAQGDVYDMSGAESYESPAFNYLVTYTVEGDDISDPQYDDVPGDLHDEQADAGLQLNAWRIFTDLIPAPERAMVAEYRPFTDGFENTLAAVDQTESDLTQWTLDIDIADQQDPASLLFTLIHEYAHILTLNDSQVTPDREVYENWDDPVLLKEKAAACPTYFTGTGCSHADSYINAFYLRFWADVEPEWSVIDEMQYADDLLPYYDALYRFYKTHPGRFIDDYAVTHPAEDIAESFTYFVFAPRPNGVTLKEQKINFFYGYPELVQLRGQILNGACESVLK